MIFILRLIIFGFGIVGGLTVSGQSTQYPHLYQGHTQRYIYQQPAQEADQQLVNHILKVIASGRPDDPGIPRFSVDYSSDLYMTPLSATHSLLRFDLGGLSCTGDTRYKGFSLESALMPGQMDVDLVFVLGRDTIPYFYRAIPVNRGITRLTDSCDFPIEMVHFDKIGIENVKLYYDKMAVDRFDDHIRRINAYYAAGRWADSAFLLFDSLDYAAYRNFPEYFAGLGCARKLSLLVAEEGLDDALNLQMHDPMSLLHRLEVLDYRTVSVASSLLERIRRFPNLSRIKDPEKWAHALYQNWRNGLDAAGQYEYEYQQFGYQLALCTPDTVFTAFLDSINVVLTPELSARGSFKNQVLHAYSRRVLNYSDSLYKNAQYRETVDVLEYLLKVKTQYGISDTSNVIQQRLYDAHMGVVNAYARVADRTLENAFLGFSKDYLEMAWDYIRCHPDLKLSTQVVDEVANRYVETRIDSGNRLNQLQQFELATRQLDDAGRVNGQILKAEQTPALKQAYTDAIGGIYQNYLVTLAGLIQMEQFVQAEALINTASVYQQQHQKYIPDNKAIVELQSRMYEKQYVDLVNRGLLLLERQAHIRAGQVFRQAWKLQRQYAFRNVREIDSLMSLAARPIIQETAGRTRLHIWANRLDSAAFLLTQIKQWQEIYLLDEDTIVNQLLTDLDRRLQEKDCQNRRWAYDMALNDAVRALREHQFVLAGDKLQTALQFAATESCQVDKKHRASALWSEKKELMIYYSQLQEVKDLIGAQEYLQALRLYQKANLLFIAHPAHFAGLKQISLGQLARECGDLDFVKQSIGWLLSEEELEAALCLFEVMRRAGQPAKLLKMELQQAGSLWNQLRSREPQKWDVQQLKQFPYTSRWYKSMRLELSKRKLLQVNGFFKPGTTVDKKS